MAIGPKVIIISGPNGAGKSTSAADLLHGALGVDEFVNADVIARGLSAFDSESVALEAGRIMLTRLKILAAKRSSFAFETTLASRSFAPWISELILSGYSFHLVYIYLPSSELAISRVAQRVRQGGHHVPEDTIRTRYVRGIRNFFELYAPIATTWRVYYNSGNKSALNSISNGGKGLNETVHDLTLWSNMKAVVSHGT